MPARSKTVSDDQQNDQLDELEQADLDTEVDTDAANDSDDTDAAAGAAVITDDTPPPDIDPHIEEEIKKVIVGSEPVTPTKAKHQLLPRALIEKELEPEDLFDKNSI